MKKQKTLSKSTSTLESGQKKYVIQGSEYTMKQRAFDIRKGSLILTQRLNKFLRDECNLEYDIELMKNDKKLQKAYNEDVSMYLVIFYSDPENIKILFDVALENGKDINLDLNTLDEITEITNLSMNLSNDFFSISGNMNLKLKK